MATAAGLVALLLGKPLPPHTAVAAVCFFNGVLMGRPMDNEMLLAAKRNGIQHILLHGYDRNIHALTLCSPVVALVANSR
jgi:hypothetical protein